MDLYREELVGPFQDFVMRKGWEDMCVRREHGVRPRPDHSWSGWASGYDGTCRARVKLTLRHNVHPPCPVKQVLADAGAGYGHGGRRRRGGGEGARGGGGQGRGGALGEGKRC